MVKKVYNFDNEYLKQQLAGVGIVGRAAIYAAILGKQPRPTREPNEYPFELVSDDDYQGAVKLGGVDMGNVLMNCTSSKNIVTTAINGKNGTIKEFWSEGDVVISMAIIVMSKDNSYPSEEVKKIMEVLNRNETIDVVSQWLNDIWGVTRLVVKSKKMSGHVERNYEVIDVGALSDEDYIVEEEFDR